MRCVVRAPAKIILLGEHWVVHGSKAVAAAVGLYARALGQRAEQGIVVSSKNLGIVEDLTSCHRFCNLWEAAQYIAASVSRRPWPARIHIESDIPIGAGMGSSAAVAVAFSACYAMLGGIKPSLNLVLRAAYAAEKIVHGNPSGIDNTVSTIGGFVLYRRGENPIRLSNVSLKGTKLLIIDTGIPRSTKIAVDVFSTRLRALHGLGGSLLELMNKVVDEAITALREDDATKLGLLLDLSHGLLNAMGVSHEALETAIHIARRSGAYGAKLTGAGMGGTAIALVPSEKAGIISSLLKERGFRVFEVEIGVNGFTIQS